ncbi:MAG: hypothetical protein GXZ11_04445 [Tissierellia bacterium]|nr:hypothetical protein [Tissierellia bacterium]
MLRNRTIYKLKNFIHMLELLLCVIIGIGIILCIPDLFKYFYKIVVSTERESFEIFKLFLNHVLILVVGVEFIIMLMTRSNESILSLVLFVIARKMLVYSENMFDLVMGTVAIAIVFLILRFLVKRDSPHVTGENIYSAALPVDRINLKMGYSLPSADSMTLGGLVYMYSKEHEIPLEEGMEFEVEGYRLNVTRCHEGVIETVQIIPIDN